jgi:excisionase family DNA binding protein
MAATGYTDLKSISQRLSVPMSTLRQWVRQGELVAYRLPGGQIRVSVEDAEALLVRVQPRTPHHHSGKVAV